MSVVQYKCPACGGAVSFDSGTQKMTCPYCESEFEPEALRRLEETAPAKEDDFGWEERAGSEWEQEELEGLGLQTCPSCGAEIIGGKNTAAAYCPYCGNTAIVSGRLSGVFRPDYVIPFRLDKNAALAALQKHMKGKRLLPKLFRDKNRIESVTGIYVPFWLFGCAARAQARYTATRTKSWSDAVYNYTKTDYYRAAREGEMRFERVPVDGSEKMDDASMEAIEPYDYSDMKDFSSAYLSGYLADKYDVDAEQAKPRANERIKTGAEQALAQTVTGYSSVTEESGAVEFSDGSVRYALLPVWMLNTVYEGKTYAFAMNGQTGKFSGSLPVDRGKYWAWFFGLFGGITAAASALIFALAALLG